KALHAETPARGVTAVARRAACFFVSHDALLFLRLARADRGDLHVALCLAMPAAAAIGVAAPLLEHHHLVALLGLHQLAGDGKPGEVLAELHALAVARHDDVLEG